MKKFSLCILFILWASMLQTLFAIKASPDPVILRLPDGSRLTIRLQGDEYFNYRTTEDGYVIARGMDGFYYYAGWDQQGKMEISNIRAHNPGAREGSEQAALALRSKKIPEAARRSGQTQRAFTTRAMESQGKALFPTTGSPKSLVLLVSFTDVEFTTPAANFTAMLNDPGYSENNATGSARDYYSDNSGGKFTPEFVVFGPVKLSRPMAYYGQNSENSRDVNVKDMVIDACQAADNAGLDFTRFDADGDGIVDNIFIYYAGYNEAEGGPEESIWPHRSYVSGNFSFDGLQLLNYACSSELQGNIDHQMAAIGTLCHEFAHVLGLPDLYDTDDNIDGKCWGVYNFSLMCSGNYNNNSRTPPYLSAVERSLVGWLEPEELTTKGDYTLQPLNQNKAYYYTTEVDGEIFILENRQPHKWDQPLPGHGLLIYHVDRSGKMVGNLPAKSRWELQNNSVNNIASHPCLLLMEADGNKVEGTKGNGGMFFPGTSGITDFTATTTPSSLPWSGMDLERNITAIQENAGLISFNYSGGANIAVEGISLETENLTLNLTESRQLVAIISPSNALNKKCEWYSSNRNVVSVNEKGVIQGLAVGTADITVMTNEGHFEAICHIKVVQDLAQNEEILVGQRDILLSWKAAKEVSKWMIKWKLASGGEYSSVTSDTSFFRLRGLQPNTKYKIQLCAETTNNNLAVILEQEVTTTSITAPFPAIGGIKAAYVAGENLLLNLVNVQSDIVSEKWMIDGTAISVDGKITLPPGEHEIKVAVKDKAGIQETIVRKITVHE